MAYNPNLYQPYGQQSFPAYGNQPLYDLPQIRQPQAMNGDHVSFVNGMEGAKAFQLGPNSRVPLFDKNDEKLYVKSTDAAGYPSIEQYRLVEEHEAETPEPSAQYVTREEFDKLALIVKGIADGEQVVQPDTEQR